MVASTDELELTNSNKEIAYSRLGLRVLYFVVFGNNKVFIESVEAFHSTSL